MVSNTQSVLHDVKSCAWGACGSFNRITWFNIHNTECTKSHDLTMDMDTSKKRMPALRFINLHRVLKDNKTSRYLVRKYSGTFSTKTASINMKSGSSRQVILNTGRPITTCRPQTACIWLIKCCLKPQFLLLWMVLIDRFNCRWQQANCSLDDYMHQQNVFNYNFTSDSFSSCATWSGQQKEINWIYVHFKWTPDWYIVYKKQTMSIALWFSL